MQFQELRQRIIEDEFVFSMYRIQNVISKIIKNIRGDLVCLQER